MILVKEKRAGEGIERERREVALFPVLCVVFFSPVRTASNELFLVLSACESVVRVLGL
jgi:hypothetical protein